MASPKDNQSRPLFESSDSRLRLQTIVRLRWFAVLGQLATIVLVYFAMSYPLPVGFCLLMIAASAWLNVYLRVRFPARYRLTPAFATVLLGYDVVQLGGLLYLTGGIENPFTVLMVAPVTVSAATLPPRNTILLGTLALAVTVLLVLHHMPLPWPPGERLQLPLVYTLGMLAAVTACLLFLAFYAWRLSKEARQMSAALTATELVLAREQRLHALDGLAAAAAHELGTPLATIVLVTKELERDVPAGTPFSEDIALLHGQARRCREILQKLTRAPNAQDPLHARLSVTQLIDEAAGPHRGHRAKITIDAGPQMMQGGEGALEPSGERQPGVLYGLGNIVENAADFAGAEVTITARWSAREVAITVEDDGPGFAAAILDAIGEPYVTTRGVGADAGALNGAGAKGRSASGLGLGFFIAKTLLERSGASLAFGNRQDGQSGAVVRVVWPREVFQARPREQPALMPDPRGQPVA